jgi:transcriptional regulator with XRE-family HTH domain
MRKQPRTPQSKVLQSLLRDLRIEAGLRQSDIAERMAIPQSMVSKYESGERRLDILEIRALCNLLGVTLSDFVRRLENNLKETDRETD